MWSRAVAAGARAAVALVAPVVRLARLEGGGPWEACLPARWVPMGGLQARRARRVSREAERGRVALALAADAQPEGCGQIPCQHGAAMWVVGEAAAGVRGGAPGLHVVGRPQGWLPRGGEVAR